MNIENKKLWIFDMDGTLTIPKHDFIAIMDELGIPYDQDIISFIEAKEKDEAARLHQKLEEIEYHVATLGEAQPDCAKFLQKLVDNGCHLGIITRNNHKNTETTLKAAKLDNFFTQEATVTRECFAPKPAPDAVHHIINLFEATPQEAIMVGDYKYDIEAGIAAGIETIFFDSHGLSQWNDLADMTVTTWKELIDKLQ